VSDIGPSPTSPSAIWGKYLDYPVDYPNGPAYNVGTSRWATDWNYIQPVVTDSAGNFDASTSAITFNLASTPGSGAQNASLYLALASDYQGPIIVTVNNTNLGDVSTTATPNPEKRHRIFPGLQ
jgi:rhamnogalacturonan endolyase